MDGPRLSLVLLVLEGLFFTFYLSLVPCMGAREGQMRFNLILLVVGYFTAGFFSWDQFNQLKDSLKQSTIALQNLNEDCARSLKDVFAVIETRVDQIEQRISGESKILLEETSQRVKEMLGILKGYEKNSTLKEEPSVFPNVYELLGGTLRRMAVIFTDLMLVLLAVFVIRRFVVIHDLFAWCFLGILALMGLFRFYLSKQKQWEERLAWIFLAVFILYALPGALAWGVQEPWPGLVALPASILLASLLELEGLSIGFTGLIIYMVILSISVLASKTLSIPQSKLLLSLAILAPLVMSAGWFFWRLRRKLLANLDEQNEGVRRSLRLRRRLLGTLLHDFNNPLQAMILLFSLKERAPEQIRLQPLVRRMGDILKNSRDLMGVEGVAPPERLRRLDWGRMVSKIEEMFGGRLAQKGISLKVDGDPALAVSCLPEVLCDSILANLVSNALKFSPRGASVGIGLRGEGEKGADPGFRPGPGNP